MEVLFLSYSENGTRKWGTLILSMDFFSKQSFMLLDCLLLWFRVLKNNRFWFRIIMQRDWTAEARKRMLWIWIFAPHLNVAVRHLNSASWSASFLQIYVGIVRSWPCDLTMETQCQKGIAKFIPSILWWHEGNMKRKYILYMLFFFFFELGGIAIWWLSYLNDHLFFVWLGTFYVYFLLLSVVSRLI